MQVVRQVARHVRQQHVVGNVRRDNQTDTGEQAAPVFGRNLFKRNLRTILQAFAVALFQFVHVLLECRGLFQRMTQVKTDDAQRQRDEERQTPAPLKEAFFPDNGGDQHHQARTEHEARNRTEVEPAPHKATFTVRRIFGDKD